MNPRKHTSPIRKDLSAKGLRCAIVASRFNSEITQALADGAVSCINAHGGSAEAGDVVWVPGAFELPYTADLLAATKRFDAIICLGAVIRGETPHFEYVSAECARGIQDVMLRRTCPIAFGVLTTDTMRQAKARSGGNQGNKGWDAAMTAIEMADVTRGIRRRRRAGKG